MVDGSFPCLKAGASAVIDFDEDMVISFLALAYGVKEKPVVHLQEHPNLSDVEIEQFNRRLHSVEKYDDVIQDFYSALFVIAS